MQSYGVLLLSNGDTTGPARYWAGGLGLFSVRADFEGSGGGSLFLEYLLPDGVTWAEARDTGGAPIEITANGGALFRLPPAQIRARADAVTPVNAAAYRVVN